MLKRDGKLFLRCLCSAALFLAVLSGLCFSAVMLLSGSGRLYTPVKVAVVDNEDSITSRILVHAVGDSDFIEGLLEVEKMNEDEAMDALYSGGAAAVVILPRGFVDDIMRGRESKGRIIISAELASQRDIVESITKMGELLLLAGQNGVFSGECLLADHDISWDVRSEYYEKVNTELLHEAMTAKERYFVIEELDFCDTGMSETLYYAVCWIVMFLLLSSIFFIPLFKTDCTSPLLQRLAVHGVGAGGYLCHKLALTFFFRALTGLAALYIITRAGLTTFGIRGVLSLILTAAFITVIGAALTLCFGNGIASSFIAAVGGLVLCGGIVPRQLLPHSITVIGDLSPFGVAKTLLSPAMGASDAVSSPWVYICAVLYAATSILLLYSKLRRVRAGGDTYEN